LNNLHDYGSPLRDLAALIVILNDAEQQNELESLVKTLAQKLADNTWLSTQEQAWVVRAANAVTAPSAPLHIKVQGEVIPERITPFVRNLSASALTLGVKLTNMGSIPAWYSLTVNGNPAVAPPVLAQGLEINRSILDLTGTPVDLADISQGSLMVVLLEGKSTTTALTHQALILDPLAAGLEIENSNLANAASTESFKWLGKLTTVRYSEALDDRFVAALALNGGNTFRLAYLVRAVAPGNYQAPPPFIEDMYRPHYRGRGKSGWIKVTAAK
jgi:hypothetical protein